MTFGQRSVAVGSTSLWTYIPQKITATGRPIPVETTTSVREQQILLGGLLTQNPQYVQGQGILSTLLTGFSLYIQNVELKKIDL
jgi:hypothetical protein